MFRIAMRPERCCFEDIAVVVIRIVVASTRLGVFSCKMVISVAGMSAAEVSNDWAMIGHA